MNYIIKILLGGLFVIALLGSWLSAQFNVVRSIEIHQRAEVIYPLLADLKHWQQWSPWLTANNVTVTVSKQQLGKGAHLAWHSPDNFGELIITDSVDNLVVGFDVVLAERSASKGLLILECEQSCKLTWQLQGDISLPMFAGYVALMMEQVLGPDMNQGLLAIKQQAEQHIPSQSSVQPKTLL